MRTSLWAVAVLLCCAVAIADVSVADEQSATIQQSAQASTAAKDKPLTEAKDASVANDESVIKDADRHEKKSLQKEAKLRGLVSSLKHAAVGVAHVAADDAADDVSQPYMKKYSKSIHARISAEKSVTAAKRRLAKAKTERRKQNEAVVAALTAERAAAVAATEHSEYQAHLLESKLAKLHETEDAVTAKAIKKAREVSEAQIRVASRAKVSAYKQRADAAEREAADAKAAMEAAFRAKNKAAALKEKALRLKKERAQLKKEARSYNQHAAGASTQFVEAEAVLVREQGSHQRKEGEVAPGDFQRSHQAMARLSGMFLFAGVAALGLALSAPRKKA